MVMTFPRIRTLIGPNIFHDRSVVVLTPEPAAFAKKTPADSPELLNRIGKAFPRLSGAPASFPRLIERIALELSEKAALGVKHYAVPEAGRASDPEAVVPFFCEDTMKHFLRAAYEWILSGTGCFPLESTLKEAERFLRGRHLSLSTRALLWAAEQRGVPVIPLYRRNTLQLGYGRNRHMLQSTRTDQTSVIGSNNAADKPLTKEILRGAAIPVPQGGMAFSLEEANALLREVGGPVVVKPHNGHHGTGITKDVSDVRALKEAFAFATRHSDRVVIESQFFGRDYRVLVIDGKLAAACEMIPAHVIGDGVHSIAELVEIENRDNPLRGEPHTAPLARLRLGAEEKDVLGKNGRKPEDVASPGQVVWLRETSNGSVGGTPKDVTDLVHPEIRLLCERASKAIDLDACGIDIILEDISKPIPPQAPCGIIEVNSCPGLHGHLRPGEAEPRHVASLIIDMLFPLGADSRIPIIALVGDTDGSVLARLRTALSESGAVVGTSGPEGIHLDGALVAAGMPTFPEAARLILTDPSVEAAVFSVSPDQIEREGLGYDASDVVILLNGAGSEKALRLLCDRIRPGGTLIVNEEDPRLKQVLASGYRTIPANRDFELAAVRVIADTGFVPPCPF